MENYINILKDSIETSISMNLFNNIDEASNAHIFNSKLVKFPMIYCKNKLNNFNPKRLKKTPEKAYPIEDRPRGDKDIESVNYYIKLLQNKQIINPIWIIKKNGKYILLDGVHRIIASYIKNKKYILAYIIKDK